MTASASAAATTLLLLLSATVQPVVGRVDDADVPVGRGGQGRAGVAQFGRLHLCGSKKKIAHISKFLPWRKPPPTIAAEVDIL